MKVSAGRPGMGDADRDTILGPGIVEIELA
jgi:hypothetical protein